MNIYTLLQASVTHPKVKVTQIECVPTVPIVGNYLTGKSRVDIIASYIQYYYSNTI